MSHWGVRKFRHVRKPCSNPASSIRVRSNPSPRPLDRIASANSDSNSTVTLLLGMPNQFSTGPVPVSAVTTPKEGYRLGSSALKCSSEITKIVSAPASVKVLRKVSKPLFIRLHVLSSAICGVLIINGLCTADIAATISAISAPFRTTSPVLPLSAAEHIPVSPDLLRGQIAQGHRDELRTCTATPCPFQLVRSSRLPIPCILQVPSSDHR